MGASGQSATVVAVVVCLLAAAASGFCPHACTCDEALRSAAPALAERGVTVLALHPGWAHTDMGGADAPVRPVDSAEGLYNVLTSAGPSKELRFIDHEGQTHPW